MTNNIKFKNLWADLAPDNYSFNDSLGDESFDCIIVGSGVVGLSAANYLLDQGLKILVLDKNRIGGNSSVSGGIINSYNDKDISDWIRLIGKEKSKKFIKVVKDGSNALIDFISSNNIEKPVKTGWIIAAKNEKEEKYLEEELKAHKELGIDVSFLSKEDLKNKINSDIYLSGYYNPDIYTINPYKTFRNFASYLKTKGCLFKEFCEVKLIDQKIKKVITGGGNFTYRYSVVAPGIGLNKLKKTDKKSLPYTPVLVATEPLSDGDLGKIDWKDKECLSELGTIFSYFRFSEDNRLIYGPGYLERFGDLTKDKNYHYYVAKKAEQDLSRMFSINAKIEYVWSGTMHVTENELPEYGYLSEAGEASYGAGASLSFGYWLGHELGKMILNKKEINSAVFDILKNHYHNKYSFLFHTPIPQWLKIRMFNVFVKFF